ncbi:extracellular solute-binding protein [Tepidicella xavieri]|jgi:putrescine transport system substrate-binding protein|uniref:Putrescine-binding periplasmic protein n=1 Tax=Tepidicella xavieri TaxID=360241 RepID=A0A4R6UEZ0_9BURK|nr:extracellular solute-binding protein [Tepidicella xavieri]TDQ44496.1 putrescine transport system substrate-binding protein [Tepidicella xavieri]
MKKSLLAVALSAVFLVACGKKEEPAATAAAPADTGSKVLNIYNWDDYIPDGMIAAFEQEFGIKVNYDTFENNETLHAKLIAGNSGYDIVVPTVGFSKKQLEAGLFQPLDKSKIPNLVNLDPVFLKKLASIDEGNRHYVPWGWGFTTVGINRQKVEAALGTSELPANSWELVFNPEYANKLRSCGIIFLDSPTEIMPAALHYIGKDPYSNNPDDIRAAGEMLAQIRPNIRLFSSNMIDDIAGGLGCAFVGWSGDINIAADRVREQGGQDEIVPLLPSTGGVLFVDVMAIPADARNVENAHLFINFFLRPENGAAMANEMNYPTGNKAALPLINDEIKNNPTIFLDEENMARLIPSGGYANELSGVLNEVYNAFKRGR